MSIVLLLLSSLPTGIAAAGWVTSAQRAGRLRRRLLTDRLTGLANRDALAVHVAAICPRAPAVGLLLADLDQFKPVNDRYGHYEGNHVLRTIARRLDGIARTGELAVRLHGDEFAFLLGALPGGSAGRRAAAHRARTVRAAIEHPITTPRAQHRVGASVGVAVLARARADLSSLLATADAAMYAAKPDPADRRHSATTSGRASAMPESLHASGERA